MCIGIRFVRVRVRSCRYTAMALYAHHTINVSIVRIKTLFDLFAMAGPVIKSWSQRLQTRVRYVDSRRPAYIRNIILYGITICIRVYGYASREHNIIHIHTHTACIKYINDHVCVGVWVYVERRRKSYQTVLNELRGEIKS